MAGRQLAFEFEPTPAASTYAPSPPRTSTPDAPSLARPEPGLEASASSPFYDSVFEPAAALPVVPAAVPVGPPRDADIEGARLERRLSTLLARPVTVTLTNNRRTMISSRQDGPRLRLRLHHMFATASDEEVAALAAYLGGGDRRAARAIDRFIANRRDRVTAPRRKMRLRTEGEHHDLSAIFEDLRDCWFGGRCDAHISWGRRTKTKRRRRRRSIQLGSYVPEDRLIRVHPVLDDSWVPHFYVETVVFHEMLHHELGALPTGSRHRFHTPEFRSREASFVHHHRAVAWEEANVDRLLRG